MVKLQPNRYLQCLAIVLIASCSNSPDNKIKDAESKTDSDRHSANEDVSLYVVDSRSSDPLKNSAEVKNLAIDSFSVANIRNGRELVGRLSYSGSRSADYAEIQISGTDEDCRSQGKCTVKKAPMTTVTLPKLKAGRHVIKVRACVNSARSTSSSDQCGEWNIDEYLQPSNDFVTAELNGLRAERSRYVAELRALSRNLVKILDEFEKDSEKCDKRAKDYQRLQGYKILVGNFLRLGDLVVQKAVSGNLFGQNKAANAPKTPTPQSDASDGTMDVSLDDEYFDELEAKFDGTSESPGWALTSSGETYFLRQFPFESLRKNLKEAEARLASSGSEVTSGLHLGALDAVRSIGTASAMIGAKTGSGAISMLGGAIFSIATADQLSESMAQCFAQTQHDRKMIALKLSITNLKTRISDINKQIIKESQK